MADENATFLNPEAQIEGDLNPEVQIEGDLNPEAEITADLEGVIEVSHTYTGIDNNNITVNVDNTNYTIEATLVPFDWLTYETSDWVQTTSYYKLVIPFSTHKCLNAYVASMMIGSPADEDDQEDVAGFENNIPTWKLLPNDSIVIKSDEPINCKVLIKGDR